MNEVYIQRGEDGKIKGVYTAPQPQPDGSCLTEPKPVSDTDPEVVEFMKRFDRTAK